MSDVVYDRAGDARTPFKARCAKSDCEHEFIVCYLPMELSLAAGLMKAARCPMCAGTKIVV